MRLEYKYLVPLSYLDVIRRKIEPFVCLDQYAAKRPNKEYTVRSIYFDNARFQYYDEKIEGYKIRKKLRIRSYDEPSACSRVFLEIKRKMGNYIDKSRASVRFDDLHRLFATRDLQKYLASDNGDLQAIEDAQRFFFHICRKSLKPVILVTYDREAFHYRFNPSLRLTFDKHLRCRQFPSLGSLFDEDQLTFPMKEHCILEIKFSHGVPFWVKELIKDFRLGRYALSKYTICMDANNRVTPRDKKISFMRTDSPEAKDVQGFGSVQRLNEERKIPDVTRFQ
jgi:hypothetical protein